MNGTLLQLAQQFHLPLQSPIVIFALILGIILIVPIVFDALRVPDIIGLIFCGIAIGPYGFHILEQDLFVDIFSTIGLMYIMFLAGLEINLIEFKFNRNKSFAFAGLTFTVPFVLGIPVCLYLLGLDLYGSLLVASIFATHTLVTYPTTTEYGVTDDRSVAIAVGGTILTDSAVLIVLAMILGAHRGELSAAFWIQLMISLALFSAFLFIIIPKVAQWFFHHFEERKSAHYIFVMVVVFVSAFLAEVAGLEGIIGAFGAGLALNKFIPSSSALMNRTAFIGNTLFIPFFLISVGMLVDIKVIASGMSTLLIAGALTVVAFAGKYIAAKLTQVFFKLSRAQGQLIFGLSSAHAAATLAVVLVGYQAGIVGDTVINAIVIVIMASCIAASFITTGAAKQLAAAGDGAQPQPDTEGNSGPVERKLEMEQILIPISNVDRAEPLLQFATLIKDKESVHPLAILNVVPDTHQSEQRVAERKEALEKIRADLSGADQDANIMATIDRSVALGIGRAAREVAADLILLNWPAKASSLAATISSSNPDNILYRTDKTVFICDFKHPIAEQSGIFAIFPQFAEIAPGFTTILRKIGKLATELSVPVKLNCNEKTYAAVRRALKKEDIALDVTHYLFDQPEDFFVQFRHLDDMDLIIMSAGRRGTIAHHEFLDGIPAKLQRHLDNVSKILVYT